MKYSIVFSDEIGNTRLLAGRIRKVMGEVICTYFGEPEKADTAAREVDVAFVGSQIDDGLATPETSAFLSSLEGVRVYLFGTCGFGGSEEYLNEVLGRLREDMTATCELAGSFMCQGKMPSATRERYERMLRTAEPGSPEAKRAQMLLDTFEHALPHPDGDDLRALEADLRACGLA